MGDGRMSSAGRIGVRGDELIISHHLTTCRTNDGFPLSPLHFHGPLG